MAGLAMDRKVPAPAIALARPRGDHMISAAIRFGNSPIRLATPASDRVRPFGAPQHRARAVWMSSLNGDSQLTMQRISETPWPTMRC
jgi:hypothetical protein